MAAAIDGVAPKFLANRNKGHAPQLALIISSVLSSLLLILNYRAGLVAAFTFLITISTLGTVMSYTMSAAADLKFSLKRAKMWVLIAIVAIIFSLVALAGSGIKDTLWGVVLLLAGLPVYYWGKRQRAAAASSLDGPENRA